MKKNERETILTVKDIIVISDALDLLAYGMEDNEWGYTREYVLELRRYFADLFKG